jgi:hypothetical protein
MSARIAVPSLQYALAAILEFIMETPVELSAPTIAAGLHPHAPCGA